MATSTTNLKLVKPDTTDLYSIDTFNNNFDTIDAAIGGASVVDLIAAAILENDKKKNPVGTIIMSTSSANPSTYMGFGTWAAWGSGRVPVGVNTGDTDFATVEKTGGSKTHTHTQGATGAASGNTGASSGSTGGPSNNTSGSTAITTAQMPAHTHDLPAYHINTGSYNAEGAQLTYKDWATTAWPAVAQSWGQTTAGGGQGHTHTLSSHTHSLNSHTHTLNSHTHTNPTTASSSNMDPYITCYMWKRTA